MEMSFGSLFRMMCLLCAIVLAQWFPAQASAAGLKIGGFNAARGGSASFATLNMFPLRNAIQSAFPGTTFKLAGRISTTLTSSVDVLFLPSITGDASAIVPLTKAERQNLFNFALNGGTVLLFKFIRPFSSCGKRQPFRSIRP